MYRCTHTFKGSLSHQINVRFLKSAHSDLTEHFSFSRQFLSLSLYYLLAHSLLHFLRHVIFPCKCEELRADTFIDENVKTRGTDNSTGEGAGVSGCHIHKIMNDPVVGGWVAGGHQIHRQRETGYTTYYSFVSCLISIFFCCRSLIGPGTHLAPRCQQSPI